MTKNSNGNQTKNSKTQISTQLKTKIFRKNSIQLVTT